MPAPLIPHPPIPTNMSENLIPKLPPPPIRRRRQLLHRRLEILCVEPRVIVVVVVGVVRECGEGGVVRDGLAEGEDFLLEGLDDVFEVEAGGLFVVDHGLEEGVVVCV